MTDRALRFVALTLRPLDYAFSLGLITIGTVVFACRQLDTRLVPYQSARFVARAAFAIAVVIVIWPGCRAQGRTSTSAPRRG